MSALPGSRRSLRILFFGLPFGISALMLGHLLKSGRDVQGVVLPAESVPHLLGKSKRPVAPVDPPEYSSLALRESGNWLDTLALTWEAGLRVWAVSDFNDPEVQALLADVDIDVACVACFTRRIPAAILSLPRFGFLNYHPSLLPAFRGPVPLFWQLRDGAPTGVTIHYLDRDLDTGDIIDQIVVPLPDGIAGPDADLVLAGAGWALLDQVLADLERGVVRRRPQPDGGSYFGLPQGNDFTLAINWPARQAYNFMRGTADWGKPYLLKVDGEDLWLAEAEGYDPDGALVSAYEQEGSYIRINFSPGVLRARLIEARKVTRKG